MSSGEPSLTSGMLAFARAVSATVEHDPVLRALRDAQRDLHAAEEAARREDGRRRVSEHGRAFYRKARKLQRAAGRRER